MKTTSLIFATLLCFTVTAHADVACDGQAHGAAGLCNAYCEALDCDGDPNASATGCEKVRGRWYSKTAGEYGDVPPCDVTFGVCPCEDIHEEVVAFLSGDPAADTCSDNGYGRWISVSSPYVVYAVYSEETTYYCTYDRLGIPQATLSLTESEFAVCTTQILQSIASQGLVCS